MPSRCCSRGERRPGRQRRRLGLGTLERSCGGIEQRTGRAVRVCFLRSVDRVLPGSGGGTWVARQDARVQDYCAFARAAEG